MLIGYNAEKIKTRVLDAVVRASHGNGMAEFATGLSEIVLSRLEFEAQRGRLFRRNIADWYNVDRTTFVPFGRSSLRDMTHLAMTSEVWASYSTRLCKDMADGVHDAGALLGLDPLKQWKPNRIGFNYMHGTREDPAEISEHQDVKTESGLVIAMNITDGPEHPRGQASVILGYDVCQLIGLPEQPEHAVMARQYRVGMTIARLLPTVPDVVQHL